MVNLNNLYHGQFALLLQIHIRRSIQEYTSVIIQSASVYCKNMQQIQLIQFQHLSLQWVLSRRSFGLVTAAQHMWSKWRWSSIKPPWEPRQQTSMNQSTTPLQVENGSYSYGISLLWPVKMAAMKLSDDGVSLLHFIYGFVLASYMLLSIRLDTHRVKKIKNKKIYK